MVFLITVFSAYEWAQCTFVMINTGIPTKPSKLKSIVAVTLKASFHISTCAVSANRIIARTFVNIYTA